MRSLLFVFGLLTMAMGVGALRAQGPGALAEIQRAVTGTWAGTLEYRDFSEPAGSTKRVKLPTWLQIEAAGAELRFRYLYDDDPGKTVTESALVAIDVGEASYVVKDAAGKVEDRYAIAGLAGLREGRGTLTLTGKGTENGAAVEVRTTLKIGRNILEITRETAAPGAAFTFRHAYTLVRAAAPAGGK